MESFDDLATQMFEHYGTGDLHSALAVAESASRQYPEKVTKTAYWKACILSLMRRPDEAVCALERGLSEGAWWAEPTLLHDPDLEESSRVAPGDQPGVSPLTEPCVRAPYTAPGKP